MKFNRQIRGVTLIELVIVIVVLGILAATAALALSARDQHRVNLQADQLLRVLSRVQLLAISQDARLRLTIASDRYSLSCLANCGGVTLSIDSDNSDQQSPQNSAEVVLLGASLAPAGAIDFDSLGRPQSGAGTLLTAASSVNLSGAGRSVTIQILPITGFAQFL